MENQISREKLRQIRTEHPGMGLFALTIYLHLIKNGLTIAQGYTHFAGVANQEENTAELHEAISYLLHNAQGLDLEVGEESALPVQTVSV